MCYSLAHSTPRAELLGGGGATSVTKGGLCGGEATPAGFPCALLRCYLPNEMRQF
jgi:hypothetical protein